MFSANSAERSVLQAVYVLGFRCRLPRRRRRVLNNSNRDRPRARSLVLLAGSVEGDGGQLARALCHPVGAGRAQGGAFQINPFHGMRWSHGAAVVLAVCQAQRVADLVHSFLNQPITENLMVGRKTIEFLS